MEHGGHDRNGLTEAEFLQAYDPNRYDRPSVTADIVLLTVATAAETNYRKLPEQELKVLLVRREGHPYIGQWALPGGFVAPEESLDQAALRVLKAETGVGDVYMEQLYTWGDPARDPRTRVVSCSYLSLVGADRLAGAELARQDGARWFSVQEQLLEEKQTATDRGWVRERTARLTLTHGAESIGATLQVTRHMEALGPRVERRLLHGRGLAFDHAVILAYALERLRAKIEWTDTALHLLPALFTLGELQQVYEVILQRELLTANFRRKTAHLVLETNHYRRDAGHRPAKLYRFNPNWSEQSV